jgi:hypothetical protein
MKKKVLKAFLSLFGAFLLFSFWMSPRLGGIIPLGKEQPAQIVEKIQFDSIETNKYKLVYADKSRDSNLIQLRKVYRLDTLVKDAKSDFEKVIKIQSWVQSRWKHDGGNSAGSSDANVILKEAEKGKRFRCVEYSLVTGQCLASLGFIIRPLGLMTKDVSEVKSGAGHAVNEVYLKDLKKWVLIDPQYDVITMKDNVPLNAVELQSCIANNLNFDIINPNRTTTKEEYEKWIGPYLYYLYVTINGQSVGVWDRIAGNKKQLTLLPTGAEKPTYFQKIFRINTSYFTNSVKDFYPVLN